MADMKSPSSMGRSRLWARAIRRPSAYICKASSNAASHPLISAAQTSADDSFTASPIGRLMLMTCSNCSLASGEAAGHVVDEASAEMPTGQGRLGPRGLGDGDALSGVLQSLVVRVPKKGGERHGDEGRRLCVCVCGVSRELLGSV